MPVDDKSVALFRAASFADLPTAQQVGVADKIGASPDAVKLQPQIADANFNEETAKRIGLSPSALNWLSEHKDNLSAAAADLRGDNPHLPRLVNSMVNVGGDVAKSVGTGGLQAYSSLFAGVPEAFFRVMGEGEQGFSQLFGVKNPGFWNEAAGAVSKWRQVGPDKLANDLFNSRHYQDWLSNTMAMAPVSIGNMAGGLIATAITKSPIPMMTWAGATTFGQTFTGDIDKGVSFHASMVHAGLDAAVETMFEKLPAEKFVNDYMGGKKFLTMLGHQLVAENLTEVPTTLMQNFDAWAITNQDKPFMDFLRQQPQAVLETVIATTLAAGAQTGILHSAARIGNQRRDEQAQVEDIKNLNEAVRSSTMTAAPEKLRALAQSVVGDGNYYVPAQQALELFANLDPAPREALLKANPDLPQQLAEAKTTGVDISIPKADYMAYIAPHPVADGLANFIKTDPHQLSAGERSQLEEFVKANPELKNIDQSVPDKAEDMTFGQVSKSVEDALIKAGRTQAEAKQFAPLFTAGIGRFSEAFGQTAQDALLQRGITFSAEDSSGRKIRSSNPMQSLVADLQQYQADIAAGKDTRKNDESTAALEDLWRKLQARGMQPEALSTLSTQEFQNTFYGPETGSLSLIAPSSVPTVPLTNNMPAAAAPGREMGQKPAGDSQSLQVSLSPAPDFSRPESIIPGMKSLLERWRAGDEQAGQTMVDYATDHLRNLFADMPQVHIVVGQAIGVFDTAEPSIPLTVDFAPDEREEVVKRLARFSNNFNQNSFHVREEVADAEGTEYPDGSYASPSFRVETSRPLTIDEVRQISSQAGLYGMTITNSSAEFYYVGNPTDQAAIEQFYNSALAAVELISSATGDGKSADRATYRLWVYGHTESPADRIIGYEQAAGGDLSQPLSGPDQGSYGTYILQRYFGGEAPRVATQAKTLIPEQRQLQTDIAYLYDKLPVNGLDTQIDGSPIVRMAYEAAAKAIEEQYDSLGVKVIIGAKTVDGKLEVRDKYQSNSAQFRSDIRLNNQIEIFPTNADTFGPKGMDFSGHPFLRKTGKFAVDLDGKPYELCVNDMLRAVHDVLAHNLAPNGVGALGEEAAWRTHMATIPDPWARWAITTETRGQNSWVNFDPVNSAKKWDDKKNPKQFAEQKTALLPLSYVYTNDPAVDAPLRELERTLTELQRMGSLDMNTARTLYQDGEEAPRARGGFYSALAQRLEQVKQQVATKEQWLSPRVVNETQVKRKNKDGTEETITQKEEKYGGIIGNLPGAKLDEIYWSGLPDYISAYEGDKITKDEIIAFLRQSIDTDKAGMQKQLLLDNNVRWNRYSIGDYNEYRETLIQFPKIAGTFVSNSTHYNVPGVLAHYRGGYKKIFVGDNKQEVDGVVVDEIQGDWDKRITKEGVQDAAAIERAQLASIAANTATENYNVARDAFEREKRVYNTLAEATFKSMAETQFSESKEVEDVSFDLDFSGDFGSENPTVFVRIASTYREGDGSAGSAYVSPLSSSDFNESTEYVEEDPSYIEEQARDNFYDEILADLTRENDELPEDERETPEQLEEKALEKAIEAAQDDYDNGDYSHETVYSLRSVDNLPSEIDATIVFDSHGDGCYVRVSKGTHDRTDNLYGRNANLESAIERVQELISELDESVVFSDEEPEYREEQFVINAQVKSDGTVDITSAQKRDGDSSYWNSFEDMMPADAQDAFAQVYGTEDAPALINQVKNMANSWIDERRKHMLRSAAADERRKYATTGVPDVPFKKNGWIPLVMKHLIIDAVASGRNYVAWTPASIQAERWQTEARGAVRNFAWVRSQGDLSMNRTYDTDLRVHLSNGNVIRFWSKDGIVVASDSSSANNMVGQKIADIVSPSVAKMIDETPMGERRDDVQADNITFNAQGYVDVYDKQMRKAAEDIGKKFGLKVKVMETYTSKDIAGRDENGNVKMWGFEIPEEMAAEVARSGLPLFQKERGQITLDAMLKNVEVTFKAGANFSTVIHEFGHYMVALHRQYAEMARKNMIEGKSNEQQLRILADWNTLKEQVGANSDEFTVEQEEKLAKLFEAYVREGRAPSPKLRSAFARFRKWLLQIYKDIKSQLGVQLNDEVRGVFDRWLASEQEIAQASVNDELLNKAAGTISPDLEQRIASYIEDAKSDAEEKLYRRLSREASQQQREAFQKALVAAKSSVEADVKAQPVYGLLDYMRKNDIKFIDGPELDGLPSDLVSSGEDGVEPDAVAELFGYGSAVKMLRDIRKAPPLDVAIERQARALLREQFPDMIESGKIKSEALASYTNDRTLLALDIMVKELGKRAGKTDENLKTMMRLVARERLQTMPMKDMQKPERYLVARDKALQSALASTKKGDVQAAIDSLKQAMLNQSIWMEATKMKDQLQNFEQMVKRINRKDSKMPQTWHPDFVYYARYVLSRYGLSKTIFNAEKWVSDMMREDPDLFDQFVSLDTVQSLQPKKFADMTAGEFADLFDAITNIIHVGRAYQSIEVEGKRIALQQAVDEVTGALSNKAGKPRPIGLGELSDRKSLFDWVREFEASLVRVEQFARWIDDDNPNGAFTKYIYRPVSDAAANSKALKAEYLQQMVELVRSRAEMYQRTKVNAPELANEKFNGKFGTKWALVSALLNYGNEQNKLNLLEGYGWREEDFLRVIERELTVEDVQFVQDILDFMERIKPFVKSEYKQRTGLELKEVEAVPFTVHGKQFRGGYYPLMANRDPTFDVFGGQQFDTRNMLFDRTGSPQWPSTRHSFQKERSGAIYPPLLDISVAMRHVEDVMHNYATAPALMQVARIFNHRRVTRNPETGVAKTYRPFVEAIGAVNPFMKTMWVPWLQSVARNTVNNTAGQDSMETAMRVLRARSIMTIMGGNIINAAQNYSSATQVIDEIGVKAWAEGQRQYLMSPKQAKQYIEQRSKEMRFRYEALDREAQDVLNQLREAAGKGSKLANKARNYAFIFQNVTDRHIAYPAWLGAYHKARAAGMSEADAVYQADRAVRTAIGSPDVKDTATVQRGGYFKQLFMMFYGYMNMVYNRQRVSNLRLRSGDITLYQWMTSHVLNLMLPNLVAAMIVDAIGGGGASADDEDWMSWYALRVLSGYFGMVPLARDFLTYGAAKVFGQKFGASITNPLASSAERVIDTSFAAFKGVADGDPELDKMAIAAVNVGGMVYNLPVGFIRNPSAAVANWLEGDNIPENPLDAVNQLVNGPPRN